MRYKVADLRASPFDEPKTVEAKSPLLAARKLFPDAERDLSNTGDIVVYGKGSYIYKTERRK